MDLLRQDVDDLASDACFRILKRVRRTAARGIEGRRTASPSTLARLHVDWAYKDAHKAKAISPDFLRSSVLPNDLVDWRHPPDREAETAELVAEIQRRASRLPPRLRAVFEAKYCCLGPSPSNSMIADMLGTSVRAVQKHLAEASERVFKKISSW